MASSIKNYQQGEIANDTLRKMKLSSVTSKWYYLRCGHRSVILHEKDQVNFKYSKILEGWIDVYLDDQYNGTIPESEFKLNFKLDNLLTTQE